MKFYVELKERVEGPYTVEQLAQMKLLYDTPIRSEETSAWKPAWQLPELLKLVAEKQRATTAAGEPVSQHRPPPPVSLMTAMVAGYGIVLNPIAWALHTTTAFHPGFELSSMDGLMLLLIVAASTGAMLSIFVGSMKIRRSPRTARRLLVAGFSLDIVGWVALVVPLLVLPNDGASNRHAVNTDTSELVVLAIITLACLLFESVALIWVLFRKVGVAAEQPLRSPRPVTTPGTQSRAESGLDEALLISASAASGFALRLKGIEFNDRSFPYNEIVKVLAKPAGTIGTDLVLMTAGGCLAVACVLALLSNIKKPEPRMVMAAPLFALGLGLLRRHARRLWRRSQAAEPLYVVRVKMDWTHASLTGRSICSADCEEQQALALVAEIEARRAAATSKTPNPVS